MTNEVYVKVDATIEDAHIMKVTLPSNTEEYAKVWLAICNNVKGYSWLISATNNWDNDVFVTYREEYPDTRDSLKHWLEAWGCEFVWDKLCKVVTIWEYDNPAIDKAINDGKEYWDVIVNPIME